ncbi:ROK family protein [Bacillus alkalicellulosilyticus]|uniref:ROK family protein n=1 Tax=Alkalihalobacterium alkalicellulosilyticum TaxID=1912214 RepID=UPI000997CD89|nr:ROK family protein [Bacillus alkalicellulosilyticus]
MKYSVGIDIGGTKIAIGIVTSSGELIDVVKLPTDKDKTPQVIMKNIVVDTKKLLEINNIQEHQLEGIGIGSPGPIHKEAGLIACPPNLQNWRNVDIVGYFKNHFTVDIYLENDASAATLGEKWVGAAQENQHFLFLTISTGIGAGIYTNGQLVRGTYGNAGDVGHIVIDPSRGKCVCGQKGCFEWVASGTAIARMASELLEKPLNTKEVFALYEQKNESIVGLVEQVFEYIGMGLVTLINTLEPEKIVIGGGVSQVGEPLFTFVQNYVKQYALSPFGRDTEIVSAGLNQEAGIVGAAALCFLAD